MQTNLSRAVLAAAVMLALGVSGCGGPDVDVAKAIKINDVTTGWFDVGVVNGQNKLVPSASFSVTNTGTVKLSGLQVMSVFRFVGEAEELGSATVALRGPDALGPSATSKPITVRATWGFSGEQPRAQMLMHTQFKDARVEIFAKYGPKAFVRLTEAKVARQLLTK